MHMKHRSRSIAFISGKGGVGQTSIILNLASAMHQLDRNCLVFDASHNTFELEHLLDFTFTNCLKLSSDDRPNIDKLVSITQNNISILPSCLAHDRDNTVSLKEQYGIINLISELKTPYDYVLIDIPDCSNKSNYLLASAANKIIFIIDETATSLLGAFQKIQTFSKNYSIDEFSLIVNRVSSKSRGNIIFNKLESKCLESSRAVNLSYHGSLYKDHNVSQCADNQTLVHNQHPNCKFSRALTDVAINIDSTNTFHYSNGAIELFPRFSCQ